MVWLWAGFILFVLVLMALDLGLLGRRDEEMTARRALRFVLVMVLLALCFNALVYVMYEHDWFGSGTRFAEIMRRAHEPAREIATPRAIGRTAAEQFLAGWLTEYSLSVDNLFVIALVFQYFKVPAEHQHRVLVWGIIGALIMRGVMILAGTAAVQQFDWVLYLLGAFLIYSGWKMAFMEEGNRDFERNFAVRWIHKAYPISNDFDGRHFFTRLPDGRRAATPLLLALLVVEGTDVIFAVDSIPAVIGITRDPFLVFTSNVFAVLGLRSLFFALRSLMDRFRCLKYSLALILAFVGAEMLLEGVDRIRPLAARVFGGVPDWLGWLPEEPIHVPSTVSLGVIVSLLAAGVGVSLLRPHHPTRS